MTPTEKKYNSCKCGSSYFMARVFDSGVKLECDTCGELFDSPGEIKNEHECQHVIYGSGSVWLRADCEYSFDDLKKIIRNRNKLQTKAIARVIAG